MMVELRSYPRVYALGHAATRGLLDEPCIVQEKLDGNQFSFGAVGSSRETRRLLCRSRGCPVDPDAPPALFIPAVETARRLFDAGMLRIGWAYRGEAFHRPKHNVIAYDRMPEGGFVLFDVDRGHEDRLPLGEFYDESMRLDLMRAPVMSNGFVDAPALVEFVNRGFDSVLGGFAEGVVIKRAERGRLFGIDGKEVMAKIVREAFKEKHRRESVRPGRRDVIEALGESLATEARWQKARQHLREAGELLGEPKDIGPLIEAVKADVEDEEGDEIRDVLWRHFRRAILGRSTRGLAEWYKRCLIEDV